MKLKRVRSPFLLMYDMVHVAYWNLHDYALALWCWISRIDPIGRYVYAMTNSERRWWFVPAFAGGGYAGSAQIKIFMEKKYFTVRGVVDIINHEVLHQILRKRISGKVCHQLDNIHISKGKAEIIIDFISNY